MGLTSAVNIALTGLNASQQRLDVTGNNIANVNTVAFKGSRTIFQTQLNQTLSAGSQPSTTTGGSNPMQVGLGTTLGTIDKNMTGGSIDTTGINTDMAIQGSGLFVLKTADNSTLYTRDGSFSLDTDQHLVSTNGNYVMGYGVDNNYNIQAGTLSNLSIPLGKLSIAQATTNTIFKGNLDSTTNPATVPGTSISEALVNKTTGNPAAGATALTNLATAFNPGINLFATGDVITLNGSQNGQTITPPATFTVTAAPTTDVDSGTTVSELMEWIQNHTAIDTTAPQGTTPGVTIDAGGKINVVGNLGTDNDLGISLSSSGAVANPINWIDTPTDPDANVGSKATSFRVYDTLGNPVDVNVNFVMESKTSTGITWRFFAQSPGKSGPNPFIGSGTITFDTNGKFAGATGNDLVLNHADSGAVDPIAFTMDFSSLNGVSSDSSVIMNDGNGYPAGTLNNFSIGSDGIIYGEFSNGLSRSLGQVALADFTNPEGLIADSQNNYRAGPNSGQPNITTPGALGTGTIINGALELSNVDITKEFVNMISATTAFSAAGKVITTSNQLLAQLLNMMQ
ncbi:MAG: flagellar hook-basal body complex protein [Phycisphaerae bacterium]